jgi:dephospho-CoA kinase
VIERDGLSRQAAQERLARAISPEIVKACATHTLENGTDPEDFQIQAKELLLRLQTGDQD